MSKFIEVNVGRSDKTIVNCANIRKIIPIVNSTGCVFHMDQGTISVAESYEDVKNKIFSSPIPDYSTKTNIPIGGTQLLMETKTPSLQEESKKDLNKVEEMVNEIVKNKGGRPRKVVEED